MKKIVSTILAVALISALCANSVSAAAFKQTVDPEITETEESKDKMQGETHIVPYSTSKAVFHRISLAQMADALSSDPDASNVRFDGNTLTFLLPDGTISQIVQTIDSKGLLTLDITEGSKTDSLTFDYSNNEAYLNGAPLTIKKIEAYVYQDLGAAGNKTGGSTPLATTSNTRWIILGNTTYYDCYTENQVRNLTETLLLSLITYLINPVVGFTLNTMGTIIQFYKNMQSTSEHTYIADTLYYDADLPDYHYLEVTYYFMNSDYTGYITLTSKDILT